MFTENASETCKEMTVQGTMVHSDTNQYQSVFNQHHSSSITKKVACGAIIDHYGCKSGLSELITHQKHCRALNVDGIDLRIGWSIDNITVVKIGNIWAMKTKCYTQLPAWHFWSLCWVRRYSIEKISFCALWGEAFSSSRLQSGAHSAGPKVYK